MGSADIFMLSRISDDAAAAVGVANQIVYVAIILFGFVATGTSVVIAQYVGANKLGEVSQISAISISLNFLFGLLISVSVGIYKRSQLSSSGEVKLRSISCRDGNMFHRSSLQDLNRCHHERHIHHQLFVRRYDGWHRRQSM
jgi:hypothetical protein